MRTFIIKKITGYINKNILIFELNFNFYDFKF